ncbi:hypothetical protein CCACVL1_18991 [Corchorus capsularis]|uniref:DUF4408 domain-containing protein n=1 Tax=Corchorus capsularis TaxID=210143 RepID=A0A1R3HJ32_COCAP|nr:hypothetical protein CCACVL1_18991 [Corchorus capsularis]
MSFFAFLFSIAFYISIFYIFSLSPSSLLSNTKFWFVISNTLILIIAADYGAFYSSKDQKFDLHEEYALHSQARSVVASSFVSQYPEVVKKSNIIPKEEEKEIIMISPNDHETKEDDQKNNEIAPDEKILEVVKFEPAIENHEQYPIKACNKISKNIEPKSTIRRSKSDRVARVTFHDDQKHVLRRSGTEKHETMNAEDQKDSLADQENEFSTMSDEELNRRVEEFIQNFNRQIRLQGARSRQLLYREE